MKHYLGTVVTGIVTDENEKAFFVQKFGVTFQLSKDELENSLTIGDAVTGFVYENSQKKAIMTTKIPDVRQEYYGWATVTQVRKDLGVFVDIGLPDKDIVVSLDELPNVTTLWPKKNNRLYVGLTVDKKDRLWATLADDALIKATAKKANEQLKNQDITATVFRLKLAGTSVITSDGYIGFLHPSERPYEPTLGEELSLRVIGVRPDGVLNVSMRPRAFEAIPEDAAMILMMLEKHPAHELPYGDKSDPDAIRSMFGISKGQFKRAVGSLLKAKKIIQENNHIRLVEEAE